MLPQAQHSGSCCISEEQGEPVLAIRCAPLSSVHRIWTYKAQCGLTMRRVTSGGASRGHREHRQMDKIDAKT